MRSPRAPIFLVLALWGLWDAPTAAGAPPGAAAPPADGSLELRAGAAVLARIAVKTPALRRGTPQVRTLQVQGHRIAEVRVPVRGRPAEEVWLADLGTKPVRVIWSGVTGPLNADEESGVAVEATPERIYEYQTAAHVTRCDGEAVRLFTRAWDFATSRFRPVLATPPEPAAQRLTARRGDPAMPAGRPLGGFHFTAASTTQGAGADARGLAAPAALDDGDPKTIWAEGMGGDGRGEFLTARASAGRYRIQGLRIIPGDATTPGSFKARNRIKRLTVAFGPQPERRFEVDFPEDPAAAEGKSRQPYWIALPAPVDSGCVTVTIRDVYPGTEAVPPGGGTTAISDLEIFTELDQPAGAERLVADVAAGTECRSRVPLLVSLGDAAVLPTAQAILAATGAGRECLVDALTRIDTTVKSAVALDALAAALVGASAEEERLIVRTFQDARSRKGSAAPVPVRAVSALMASGNAQPDDRVRAARVLGELDEPDAGEALLQAAGTEPAALRFAIVQALGKAPHVTVAVVAAALEAARVAGASAPTGARGGGRREGDLLRVLPALVRRTPGDRPAALEGLRRALASDRGFEVRGRAILALGAVGDPVAAPDLVKVRQTSDDAVLRFLATRELAAVGGPEALEELRAALGDRDPRVREAAAQGLGRHRAPRSEEALIRAAKDEPWPFARRSELEALSRTCGPPARDLMIRAMERDVDEVRRAAIVGVVRCRDSRARTVVLTILKARRASATLRELAGALVGELGADHRDPTLGKTVAEILASLVNEAEGDLAIEGVAVTTLRALGTVGGQDAAQAAATLATDTRHPYRQVALETLGEICDPQVGAKTLATVRAGGDPHLAATAQAAEKRCAESASGGGGTSRRLPLSP
jgi:HEAT repeat protein